MDGHKLYIALRLMNKGSVADVMRYSWPGGMEEDVVRCILKQALNGLKFVLMFQTYKNVDIVVVICMSMDLYTVTSRLQTFS